MIESNTIKAFFTLIRIGIGEENIFPYHLNETEWTEIFELSKKQALLGIVFDGINKLEKTLYPPQSVIFKWLSAVQNIERNNKVLNKYSVLVSRKFSEEGFHSVILKGQGNALWYPNPLHRQSGDIDIWLDGGREKIMDYVRRYFPKAKARYHHVDFPAIKGLEIEVHFTPTWMCAWSDNKFLQKWFDENLEKQIHHAVLLPNEQETVNIPTKAFNRIFLLIHIYRHYFDEGIGLRQLLDYALLLKQGCSEEERAETVQILKKIHLLDFTSAIMYILQRIFGLEDKYMLVTPSEKAGIPVLHEIMQTGNFGYYNTNINRNQGKSIAYFTSKLIYKTRFMRAYPRETIWGNIFWCWQRIWRIYKGYV